MKKKVMIIRCQVFIIHRKPCDLNKAVDRFVDHEAILHPFPFTINNFAFLFSQALEKHEKHFLKLFSEDSHFSKGSLHGKRKMKIVFFSEEC